VRIRTELEGRAVGLDGKSDFASDSAYVVEEETTYCFESTENNNKSEEFLRSGKDTDVLVSVLGSRMPPNSKVFVFSTKTQWSYLVFSILYSTTFLKRK
jgi:hypothetical protein